MTEDIVVATRDLTYSYARQSTPAVDGVSLMVRRGELYALLGTNGAGKTSTLEVLEGHRRPTGGTVRILGGDPTDRRAIRPRVGVMLQDSGVPADLTTEETLALGGRISGRTDRVDDVLAAVELTSKASTRVAQLSGGEKRRLDFAIAVWGSPELVFLDEPTTGLDPAARDRLWQVVARLRDRGTTVVLTTHYLEEAEREADRIGLMHDGRLVREGTIAQLVAGEPARIRFVAPTGVDLPLPVTRVEARTNVIETDDLQRDLTLLLQWAHRDGHRLDDLSATPSGLDDVFRRLAS
jgi:ABC-2 type transport system ATP-binding protein